MMAFLVDQYLRMVFFLLCAHAAADRPLQGKDLSDAKNRRLHPKGPWAFNLAAHALIHGGFVGYITGFWWLGVAEAISHAVIDDAKCTGRFGLKTDQALHLGCKMIWAAISLAITYGSPLIYLE